MPAYCVNRRAQSTGDHEVHNIDSNCPYLPFILNQVELGYHESCASAVAAAREHFPTANGCYNCATDCYQPRAATWPRTTG